MCRHPFAIWHAVMMLVFLAVGSPAHAVCTAGNPNAMVIEFTPTSDFIINGNGTVTHAKTQLMWKQCAESLSGTSCTGIATAMNWANALNAANTANTTAFAGYTDWRLPNVKEIESIVEFCGYNPAINQVAFPATPTGFLPFWSSSSFVSGPTGAWFVFFSDGNTGASDKAYNGFVRLVRGGQSLDSFSRFNSVTYNGNTNTGGNPPTYVNEYAAGDIVTVLDNTGALVKTYNTFAGWNTAADGSGIGYAGGATFSMGSDNVTLYAQWTLTSLSAPTNVTITPGPGRATITFTAPADNAGTPITGYRATCMAAGKSTVTATGTDSPIIVIGLIGNVVYSCSVAATSGNGTGPSSPSVQVSPSFNAAIVPILMLLLD